MSDYDQIMLMNGKMDWMIFSDSSLNAPQMA